VEIYDGAWNKHGDLGESLGAGKIAMREVMEDPFPIVSSSIPLPLIIQLLKHH